MERNGKTLKQVPTGDKRRLSDGRNAVRKMTDEQRAEFAAWCREEFPEQFGVAKVTARTTEAFPS